MRSKNYKLHKRGTRLLVYAVVSVISLILLLFAVGESVKKEPQLLLPQFQITPPR